MKKACSFFLLISLFATQFRALARENKILFEPDTTINGYAPFNKVSFLDLRHNKKYIGSLLSGVKHNGIVPVFSLDSMLCCFAKRLTAPVVTKADNTLLIALSEINLEQKNNRDFVLGNLYLHVDFYLGNNDKYTKVLSADTLFEFGVGNKPMLLLSQVFNQIFEGMLISLSNESMQLAGPFYTPEDIQLSDSVTKRSYPVYYQEPQKGIYYSLQSFLNNQPDDTVFVQSHNITYDIIVDNFYTSTDGKKKINSLADTTCYAIYNGKKWYTPFGNQFKEMKIRDNDFYYMEFGKGLILPSYQSNFYFVPIGGVVGAVISSGVQTAVYGTMKGRGIKGKTGDAIFRYKLNPQTGDGIKVERLQ